ncbi:hypothetical protein TNCV_3218191 [Trichonephila clavipes]|nr:hypothetical protein TNCV_3218191 [Trichonephila clavipes]
MLVWQYFYKKSKKSGKWKNSQNVAVHASRRKRIMLTKVHESHVKIMFDPSSFANPTPLAHADTSRDVLTRGGTSQLNLETQDCRNEQAMEILIQFSTTHLCEMVFSFVTAIKTRCRFQPEQHYNIGSNYP